ncbi:hypothetical protein FACS189456_1570 [Bacteroidia bacterium]|nr:hypothetical protein FACS189456_1570 [Bacteroidia bacterium]
MKIALLGFGNKQTHYAETLMRSGFAVEVATAATDETPVVLLNQVRYIDDAAPHLRALRNVFIVQSSLSQIDLLTLHKLAQEASVVVQFSAPALYQWHIATLCEMLQNVKLARVIRDVAPTKNVSYNDLRNELLAAICTTNAAVNKVKKTHLVLHEKCGVIGFSVDFANAAVAHFEVSNAAFDERHELCFWGDNGRAVVDVAQGKVMLKTNGGADLVQPILSLKAAQETEITDFVQCVEKKQTPMVNEISMATFVDVFNSLTIN